MNDVQKMRQNNLRRLLQSFRFKSEAAEVFGFKNSSYVSQMLSGHRPIGERTARRIEKSVGKPHLWLDQNESLSPQQLKVIEKIKDFPEEHLYALSAFVDSLSSSKKKIE